MIYKLNCEIVYDNRLGIFSQENVFQNTDTVSIEGLDTIRNYTDDYAAISGLNVLGARGLEIPGHFTDPLPSVLPFPAVPALPQKRLCQPLLPMLFRSLP